MPLSDYFKSAFNALSPVLEEKQQVPAMNALEYSNMKQMLGREPRASELPDPEMIQPGTYAAGQVSGTNVAGGAPGPRYGRLVAEDDLAKGLLQGAREYMESKLQPLLGSGWGQRIYDYIDKHPNTIRLSTNYGGKGAAYDLDTKRVLVNPDRALEGYGEELMSHELFHALQDLARRVNDPIQGLRRSIGGFFDSMLYDKLERPGELFPNLMSGKTRTVVTDPNLVRKEIEALTPRPGATFLGVQEGAGRIPSMKMYNLTQDITDPYGKLVHPRGSTVSEQTLQRYKIPYERSD